MCVDRNGFFVQKLEPISQFTNAIGLFIFEFKIRGLLPERIYCELRKPPVLMLLHRSSKNVYENFSFSVRVVTH
jgi:hypothetical protein